ncbi:DUF11 domain-containing protein, partial [Sediminibacterium sp.]|uniref:DUF11 domain-containing protein n=1 Tax=Sediminibacterium sp. TaxID=1917865 RepID=UPI002734DB23
VNIAVYNTPWFWYDKINDYLYSYVKGNSPVFMWSAVNSLTRDEATGVVLEYIIPKGFELVGYNNRGQGTISYSYDAVNKNAILTWNVGYMPKGGAVTTYVTLLVKEVGNKTTDLTTIASMKSLDQYDTNRVNDQNIKCAIDSPPSADIQVNQTYLANSTHVTYSVVVTNYGPSNATGLNITDILPAGVRYVNHTISNNGGVNYSDNDSAYNATTGVWNIGNFTYGTGTRILNITALLTGTGTIINTAMETYQSESDSNYNNNAQSTYLTIH